MRTPKLTTCCGRTRLSQRRSEWIFSLLKPVYLLCFVSWLSKIKVNLSFVFSLQDKEIYRWPIKESIKAMLAWEWTLEKARDGETEKTEVKTTRKISQTAQVTERWKKKDGNCMFDEPINHTYTSVSCRPPMIPARDTLPSQWS